MASLAAATYRFTSDQQKAMDHFFSPYIKQKEIQVKDWNELPDSSPVWAKCLSIIISDYQIGLQFNSPNSAQKAVGVLAQLPPQKNLKRFFCEHLFTDLTQIEKRLHQFISRMDEEGHYVCLVPSNMSCLVEFNAVKSFSSSFKSKQLDLLLDEALEKENIDPVDASKPKKIDHITYKLSIVLPGDEDKINRIAASVESAVCKKIKQLNSPNWLLRTTLIAGLAIGLIVLAKQPSGRQWMEELSKHWIVSMMSTEAIF